MKTIESRIAPNPMEAQIWVDLSADAHGLVKKYWNGKEWIEKGKSDSNHEDVKSFCVEEIEKLKYMVELVFKRIDTDIEKLTNKINALSSRIKELEQLIVE